MTPKRYYEISHDFKQFVDKVSNTRKIPVEELFKHKMIAIVMQYYIDRKEDVI